MPLSTLNLMFHVEQWVKFKVNYRVFHVEQQKMSRPAVFHVEQLVKFKVGKRMFHVEQRKTSLAAVFHVEQSHQISFINSLSIPVG